MSLIVPSVAQWKVGPIVSEPEKLGPCRVWPQIRNFEMFRLQGEAKIVYVRMKGEGSVNAIFIVFRESTPIFGVSGVINPENGPYDISIGLQKGTSSGVIVPIVDTIEQLAEKINRHD